MRFIKTFEQLWSTEQVKKRAIKKARFDFPMYIYIRYFFGGAKAIQFPPTLLIFESPQVLT